MSFQNNITSLETAFIVLTKQAESTAEDWNDLIQKKFYEQFVNSLPKEVNAYLTALSKLDKQVETAEKVIHHLQREKF